MDGVIRCWRRCLERGGRARSHMKHRIQNLEYRIQKVGNAQSGEDAAGGTRASVVAVGRTGYRAGSPANIRGRWATRFNRPGYAGPEAGVPGKAREAVNDGCREHRMWQEAVGIQDFYRIGVGFYRIAAGFYRINGEVYRFLPAITASYRINFCGGRGEEAREPRRCRGTEARAAWNQGGGGGVREYWSIGEEAADIDTRAKLFGKITDFYAVFHDFPHFYAQIRAVFTRCLASQARHEMGAPSGLFAYAKCGRIVTGGTLYKNF